MDCPEVTQNLEWYVLDGLSAKERLEVGRHLAACPRCRQAEAGLRRLVGQIQDTVVAEPLPLHLLQSTQAAMAEEIHVVRRRRFLRPMVRIAGAVAASLAVALGAWHWYLRPGLTTPVVAVNTAGPQALPPRPDPIRASAPTPQPFNQSASNAAWQTANALSVATSLVDGVAMGGPRMYLLRSEGLVGELTALEARSARPLWRTTVPGVNYLTADESRVFCLTRAPDQDLELIALDGGTGKIQWRAPLQETQRSLNPVRPIVLNGQRICWTGNTGVHLLNAVNGQPLWSRAIAGEGLISSAVAVDDEIIVASSAALYSLQARDGAPRWRRPLPPDGAGSARPLLAVTAHAVLVSLRGRPGADHLICLDRDGNQVVWEKTVPRINHLLTVAEGVYLRGQNIQALDLRNGRELWSFNAAGPGPLTFANGRLYFVDKGKAGRLVALNATVGSKVWELGGLAACDAFQTLGETGYVKTQDGMVHAIALADPRNLLPNR